MRTRAVSCVLAFCLLSWIGQNNICAEDVSMPSAADYPTLQEALDANPGQMVYLPPGDYTVDRKVNLMRDGSGLFGPGRIVQTNPDQPIIDVDSAKGAQIRDCTLTRPEGQQNTTKEAIMAVGCEDLVVDNVQVRDNRTVSGAIYLRECRNSHIRDCLVENYMSLGVDDRTGSADWGYAFNCIDGTGIIIKGNQFLRNDLWGIMLCPGATSRAADNERGQNVDGGTIVSDNLIADFGRGNANWIWTFDGPGGSGCCPIVLDAGQEPTDPPLRDVLIRGNIVYSSARDDGGDSRPGYKYAVFLNPNERGPKNVVFSGNLFHPGAFGVSNVEIKQQ